MHNKTLFIEPRQVGKTLKLVSLYQAYKQRGYTVFVLLPNSQMKYTFSNSYPVSKKDLIVGDKWDCTYKLHGSENIVVLIDEFFYIRPDLLNQINSDPHVKHIIGFSTPNKLYPKNLVKLVRKNIDSNIIFEKYNKKFKIYNPEERLHIKDLIKELKNHIITNPEFEIINTIQKTKRYDNLMPEEQRLLSKGNYLISDEKYFDLMMKPYPIEDFEVKYYYKPNGF
mgnify:CR=1 FL=1